jgi:hypothetical protein
MAARARLAVVTCHDHHHHVDVDFNLKRGEFLDHHSPTDSIDNFLDTTTAATATADATADSNSTADSTTDSTANTARRFSVRSVHGLLTLRQSGDDAA